MSLQLFFIFKALETPCSLKLQGQPATFLFWDLDWSVCSGFKRGPIIAEKLNSGAGFLSPLQMQWVLKLSLLCHEVCI